MATTYSFSRLESFGNCRLQYKYRYIDRFPSELETIEAFMGSRVHDALKELYDFIRNGVVKPQEWLISCYDDVWHKNFSTAIKIVKSGLSADDYYRKGKMCLLDYYEMHAPFDRTKVVKTEEPISFPVKYNEGEYSFYGILDRLDWNDKENIFEIHDYKTSGSLMTQAEADANLQLPIYQLALLSRWPEAREARLIWHYLQFNKQIESRRTEEQLAEVKETVIRKIKEIEASTDFPPFKSSLCEWCGYQDICPLWKHPKKMEAMEANVYLKDPGVRLVEKYAELEEEKRNLRNRITEIEEEQAKIEEAALEFAEKEGIQVIDGPDHHLVVTIKEELSAPMKKENEESWQGLRDVLIRENKYTDVTTVNNAMLNKMLRVWPPEILEKVKPFLTEKVTRKVDLKKKK